MARSGLHRTKSVEQSIADTDEPGASLRRDLNSLDLTIFGIAVAIGAGIFTLAASSAGDLAGPSVSLAFVLSAITVGLAVMCYAEFASTVPVAGSAYTFSYATFGEFIAWLIGWDLVLEFTVAAAAVGKGWSVYLQQVFGIFFPSADIQTTVEIGGIAVDWGVMLLVAVLGILLSLGTKLSSRVSTVITLIKVAVVLLVIVVGIGYVKTSNYTPFIPEQAGTTDGGGSTLEQSLFSVLSGAQTSVYGVFGLLAAASIVFFAFIGFDVVATTAEEVRNPRRDIPRGILGSLVIVTVLYIGTSLVVTGMVPYTELATGPDGETATLATAFESLGVTWAASVISIGALLGLTTVVMVLLLGQVRVLFAMSRDGLMPRSLAKTGRRGTPVRMTMIITVLVMILGGFIPISNLAEMVNVGTLFAFILVSAGVLVLRRTRPDLERGFRVPLVPLIPILAVLACAWLMINLTVLTWLRFVGWMAIGLVIYFVYSRHHSVLGKRQKGQQAPATGETVAQAPESSYE